MPCGVAKGPKCISCITKLDGRGPCLSLEQILRPLGTGPWHGPVRSQGWDRARMRRRLTHSSFVGSALASHAHSSDSQGLRLGLRLDRAERLFHPSVIHAE